MKVTLFMAMSLNGLIARPDYREDFLSRQNWDSFVACARRTGAFIRGQENAGEIPAVRPPLLRVCERPAQGGRLHGSGVCAGRGLERAASPSDAFALLQAHGVDEATLAGGSILNTSFAREQLIDAAEIHVEAVVVGKGIPLFAPDDFDLYRDIAGVRQITDRIVQIRYTVRRG